MIPRLVPGNPLHPILITGLLNAEDPFALIELLFWIEGASNPGGPGRNLLESNASSVLYQDQAGFGATADVGHDVEAVEVLEDDKRWVALQEML